MNNSKLLVVHDPMKDNELALVYSILLRAWVTQAVTHPLFMPCPSAVHPAAFSITKSKVAGLQYLWFHSLILLNNYPQTMLKARISQIEGIVLLP